MPTTWTLFHEVLFYLVFAAAMVSRRAAALLAVGWTGLIVANLGGWRLHGLPFYVVDPVNLLFGMGGAAALWAKRGGRIPVRALLAVAAVAAVMMLRWNQQIDVMPSRLLWGLIWTAMVAALVAIEQRRRLPIPRPLLVLGKSSYIIYLIHIPLQNQLFHLARFFEWQRFLSPEA